MATPVGHYLLGLSVAQLLAKDTVERRRQSLWLAAIACVPDLDVIPGIFVGNLARFHHGVSHSFFAGAVFAFGGLWILRWLNWKVSSRLFLLLFFLYASHILLDLITLDNGSPVGMPMFWPWNLETYQSPWLLLPNVQHTRASLFSGHNLFLMAQESLVFFPLLGLMQGLTRWPRPWLAPPVWLYGAWFVGAVSASCFSLYER